MKTKICLFVLFVLVASVYFSLQSDVKTVGHQETMKIQKSVAAPKVPSAQKTVRREDKHISTPSAKTRITSPEYRSFVQAVTQTLRLSETDAQHVFDVMQYGGLDSSLSFRGFDKNSRQLRETLQGAVYFVETSQCPPKDRALFLNLLDQIYVASERWPDLHTSAVLSMSWLLSSRSGWAGVGFVDPTPDPEAERFPNKGIVNWYQNSYRTKLQSLGVNSKVDQ